MADSLGAAEGYNVFVFTALQSSSDIGGRAAAGTFFKGTSVIGTSLNDTPSIYDVVAGQGIAAGGQVQNNGGGSAYLPNGVRNSNILMNHGGNLVTDGSSPIDFVAAQSQYQALSLGLSNLAVTGTISNGTLNATSNAMNVFDLTAAQMLTLANINTNGGTVIINVAGTPGIANNNMSVNGSQNTAGSTAASKVLFNFYQDAGTVTLGNAFGGSVLAPWATVSGNSQYNGTIIANSLNFTGAIYGQGEFASSLPTMTPEPGSTALLGLLLIGVACLTRNRKRRSRAND